MILKDNTKIPLDQFINKVLYDKSKGYYMNKNPIGYRGDFIVPLPKLKIIKN